MLLGQIKIVMGHHVIRVGIDGFPELANGCCVAAAAEVKSTCVVVGVAQPGVQFRCPLVDGDGLRITPHSPCLISQEEVQDRVVRA